VSSPPSPPPPLRSPLCFWIRVSCRYRWLRELEGREGRLSPRAIQKTKSVLTDIRTPRGRDLPSLPSRMIPNNRWALTNIKATSECCVVCLTRKTLKGQLAAWLSS
jgi:hypothetical protein